MQSPFAEVQMSDFSRVIDTRDSGRVRACARLFVVLSAFAGLTAAACSSSPEPSPEPELRLEGRYALEAKDGSSPRFTSLWFGKDGRYEGVRARCSNDCLESGTFAYTSGEVSLLAAGGATAKMRIRPTDRAPAVSTSALRPRSDDALGADTEESGDADDPCVTGPSTKSLSPRADDDSNALLSGEVTCLITGRMKGFDIDDPQEAATAKLEGNLPPSTVANSDIDKSKGTNKSENKCGWFKSCKRYMCYTCENSDNGRGCVVDKSGSCNFLCKGYTESRCTGWTDSNTLRRCGTGDGCGRTR